MPWSELVEPGRSAAYVVDHHREVHECRCPGTRLELLPARVAVGLGFGIVVPVFQPFWRGNPASVWGQVVFLHCWLSLRLVGRLGAFLPHVVMATGGSRYDGIGWAGGRGGSRVGHHILSHSGHFKRSSRV